MQPDAVFERLRAFAESLGYSARLRESVWCTPGANAVNGDVPVEGSRQAVDDDRRRLREEAREVERCLPFQGSQLPQGLHDHVERLLQLAVNRVDQKCTSVAEAHAQAAEIRKLAGEFGRAADDPVAAFSSPSRWLSLAYLDLLCEQQRAESLSPASENGAPKCRYGSIIPPSLEEAEETRLQIEELLAIQAAVAAERIATDDSIIPLEPRLPSPAEAKAYVSFLYAERTAGKALKDGEAYDWLAQNRIDSEKYDEYSVLSDYRLPRRETWMTYVIKGRSAVGQKKNESRAWRRSRSVVPRDQL